MAMAGDNADTDDDNDGFDDTVDAHSYDASEWSNNDGDAWETTRTTTTA